MKKSIYRFDVKTFLVLTSSWVLLWTPTWRIWFANLPWLRLGLAFFIIIAPGILISLLLVRNRFNMLTHFTSGLVLSTLILSILGLVGRVANLPFGFIKTTFFGIGLIVILLFTLSSLSKKQLYKPINFSLNTLVLLLFIIAGSVVITLWDRFGNDDWSTLAYLTNWQHANPLSFLNVYFSGGYLDPIRSWIAMYPMVQAFLADISGLHGLLLIGFYLGPILVPIAIVAMYNLYEDLLKSEQKAIIAVLLQLTIFFILLDNVRQPGFVFFLRLPEDKAFAAFILAPVFFLGIRLFLQSSDIRAVIYVLLTGWSITLIHPVVLAYSIFIAGLYAAIVTLMRKDFRTLGLILFLLLAIILPAASLRFVNAEGMGTRWAFDIDSAMDLPGTGQRVSYITGTPFYGFNLKTLIINTGIKNPSFWLSTLSWLYFWILGGSFIWAMLNLKRRIDTAPIIAASALLVLLCAIPYTGWLVGYFVAARMLWRSSWMFPVGLAGVIIMSELFNFIAYKISATAQADFIKRVTSVTILVACLLVSVFFSIFRHEKNWEKIIKLTEYKMQLEEFVALGYEIDANIEKPSTFLASSVQLMNYLPGLSSRAKVVYFRQNIFTPYPVKQGDLKLVFSSDTSISIQKRIKIIEKYEVQYLLANNLSQINYYFAYPEYFTVQQVGPYWLLEFQETASSH